MPAVPMIAPLLQRAKSLPSANGAAVPPMPCRACMWSIPALVQLAGSVRYVRRPIAQFAGEPRMIISESSVARDASEGEGAQVSNFVIPRPRTQSDNHRLFADRNHPSGGTFLAYAQGCHAGDSDWSIVGRRTGSASACF